MATGRDRFLLLQSFKQIPLLRHLSSQKFLPLTSLRFLGLHLAWLPTLLPPADQAWPTLRPVLNSEAPQALRKRIEQF